MKVGFGITVFFLEYFWNIISWTLFKQYSLSNQTTTKNRNWATILSSYRVCEFIKDSDTIVFIDDSSGSVSQGAPKDANDYQKYSSKNTDFYDGTDLKATIGSYPINDYKEGKNYLEGKIYKMSIYKKALNADQVLHNYLQGAEDFDITSNTAVNATTSVSSSSGGY